MCPALDEDLTAATARRSSIRPRATGDPSDFRKLWAGQTLSVFGDQFTLLAIPLAAALTLDASPVEMGVLTAAGWLPHLLFSLHAGLWIDRRGRRRQRMIASDLGRAAVLLTVPLAYAAGALTLPHLYAVAFVVGSLAVVFDLCWNTLFVSVVQREDFIVANARLFQSRALASAAGPPLAGGVVQLVKAAPALVLDALSYLASAYFLCRVRAEEPAHESETDMPLGAQLTAGARWIIGHPLYRASLLSFSTANLFNLMFMSVFFLYATRELNIRPIALGIILGGGAAGGLLGAAISPTATRRLGVGPSMIFGSLLFSTPLLLIPAASGSEPAEASMLFTALFLSAVGVTVLDITGNSLNAALVPDRLRARVTGTHRTVNYGMRPIGALLGGALGSSIGLRPAIWVATAGLILPVMWLLPLRALRALPDASS